MCQDEIGYYSVGRWMGGVMLLFYVLICMIRSYFPKVKRYVVMTWTIHCLIFTWIITFKQWISLLICRHCHHHAPHEIRSVCALKKRSSERQTRLVSKLETHKMYHPWTQRIHHIAVQHWTLARTYSYMQKIEYFRYFTPKNTKMRSFFRSVCSLARSVPHAIRANKCYFHIFFDCFPHLGRHISIRLVLLLFWQLINGAALEIIIATFQS